MLVRKPGKLPHKRISMTYDLEYGKDTLEMHADAIVAGIAPQLLPGDVVVILSNGAFGNIYEKLPQRLRSEVPA